MFVCPQCLETAVRFLLALDLKLNDKVNPTHYAWQAGVGRSMFDVHQFLFRLNWPLFSPEAAFI